jgi:hypothetical protein
MRLGNVIQLGIPAPESFKGKVNHSFLRRLHDLEDRKMDLYMRGAFFLPHLMLEVEKIDRKLNKYYNWYATAWMAGKV